MAIAHLCTRCGHNLARVRPVFDADARLPVLHCPACGLTCVRRRHELRRCWRRVQRLESGLRILLLQLACFTLFVLLTIMASLIFPEMLARRSLAHFREDDWIAVIALLGLMPVGLGAWLSATLPHWRRGRANVAFVLFAAAVVFLIHGIELLADYLVALDRFEMLRATSAAAPWNANWHVDTTTAAQRSAMVLLLIFLASHIGTMPGRAAARLVAHWRSVMFRTRLRRARLRSSHR